MTLTDGNRDTYGSSNRHVTVLVMSRNARRERLTTDVMTSDA